MLSRLKFEINGLVEEILDRLPADVWTSETTTFLDPSMAGGQFLRGIVARLIKAGHSVDNIHARVVGLADSPLSLNFVKNKYKLPATLYVGGIETLEQWSMSEKKFDVVLGNPPYQDATGNSTNSSTLWDKFVTKATELVKDTGYIIMVTPQSWMRPNHPVLLWFKQHSLYCVNTKISHHFPKVNSTFCYWLASPQVQPICAIDGVTVDLTQVLYLVPGTIMSIHNKVVFSNTAGVFELLSDQVTAHTEKLSKGAKRFSPTLSKVKTGTCVWPIFHTNAQTLYSSLKTKNFDDKKVMFSDSGYFKPTYDKGTLGSSQRCHYFLVSSDKEGIALANVLNSKVYQYVVSTGKWSGFSDLRVLRNLPKVDLTRTWTDAELYAHFNLTQDEIDLIEATVK